MFEIFSEGEQITQQQNQMNKISNHMKTMIAHNKIRNEGKKLQLYKPHHRYRLAGHKALPFSQTVFQAPFPPISEQAWPIPRPQHTFQLECYTKPKSLWICLLVCSVES